MRVTRNKLWRGIGVLGVGISLALAVQSRLAVAQQQSFEDQRKAVSVSPATASQQAVIALLEAGLKEHQPTQASATAQQWLRENVAEDPRLLYLAGRAAELSGDWKSASALYRQFLGRADLGSKEAGDAAMGAYTLLINQLADGESAYALARSEGHRLVANTQARQFDRWFLEQAKRRGDAAAVADRLLALVEAGVSDDLLIAQYDGDFRWLLKAIVDWRLDQPRFKPGFTQAVQSLAKRTAFDPELARRLEFEVLAKQFNMDVIDGNAPAPPIEAAQALLSRYPGYALRVQTAWAGGHRGRHYRDDQRKYWPVELEAKMVPVKSAVGKLSPGEQAWFYQSWASRYYDSGPQVLDPQQARAWAIANPDLANSKAAPELEFGWSHQLELAEARELAAALKLNPSPEASLLRAIVAAGESKDVDAALEALLGSEAWRLGEGELGGRYADQLWHWAGRPGDSAKRDQMIARSKQLAESIKRERVTKDSTPDQRLAAFNKLWSDYHSNQPKLPAVRSRLFATLTLTPQALPTVLKDDRPGSQLLAREALEAGIAGTSEADAVYTRYRHHTVSTQRYDPGIVRLARQHRLDSPLELKDRRKNEYMPHPLGPAIEAVLVQQIKQNKPRPWLVLAWLNTRFPEEDAESAKVMSDLMASPAWKAMPYEVRFGARQWFADLALTPAQRAIVKSADPAHASAALLALPEDADAGQTAEALIQTIAALRQAPVRHEVVGLDRLGRLSPEVIGDPAVMAPLMELIGPMRSFATDGRLGPTLLKILAEQKDPAALHAAAPFLWRHTEVHHRTLKDMIALAGELSDEHPSASSALARCGLQTIARHTRGHTYYDRESDVPALTSIRGKAALAMGLIDIPVPRSHPAYGVFQSQAEFVIGNQDSARELYNENADQLLGVHRDLSVSYLLWALQVTLENRDEARQEALAKALMQWMQASANAFTLEQRVQLEIAYGDIALQRGMLPEAQRIFARIRNNPAYESVFARHTATLRQVLVERVSGDYDGALQTLMELDSEKIPRLTTAAHYARAEVYYAMQEYQDAADEVVKVLEREPDHADATILRGRVQLKLQRLIEATEVELGSAASQNSIVPGEELKVTLNDPTLSVSGGGTDIEVVVWATSGDREHLMLRQFGDDKTKYRGEVRTALGEPEPDDRTLQVVGDDEIFYAYSEAYREKIPNLGENRGGPITVASDALLMASARKLLSENEQRVADMRAATQVIEKRLGSRASSADPETVAQLQAEAAERSRREAIQARVKPGNPLYLRVVDPDRSRTAGVDELAVSVGASSGDSVARVLLKETGTHTGVFEASLQTTGAQAAAFALSSEAGRNPNMVISPNKGYPAWRPVVTKDVQHQFTVDLNDNAPIGSMRITADDEGYALKRFIVQTAMNSQDWTTVASYPAAKMMPKDPWQPSVTVVNEEDRRAHYGARSVYEIQDLRAYMQAGWLATPDMALAKNVAGPGDALPASVLTDVKWLRSGRWSNPAVVVRFQAYFYEPVSTHRRFELKLGKHTITATEKNQQTEPEFLIAVDGRVITSKEDARLHGGINLKPGVHKLEVWATGWIENIGFGRDVQLRVNLGDEDTLIECPEGYFDPTTFPEGVMDHRNGGATIVADEGGGQFEVKFAEGSRTRLVRLLFVEHAGPVPSISRIALSGPGGEKLLPVAEDYAGLRKNDLLEIITGDRVTARYLDDRYVTKGRQKHERFLDVAFTDGRVEFADIEPRYSNRHQGLRPYHERLLRFAYDKPLPVVVYDADMDVSVEPDRVTVRVSSGAGEVRELIAEETGASTGVFRAWVTPVKDASSAKDKIQVAEGGALTAVYRDAENLRPGVPYERVESIGHAAIVPPRIEIAHMQVTDFKPEVLADGTTRDHVAALNERLVPWNQWEPELRREDYSDRIKTRYQIAQRFVDANQAPEGGVELVHGRHALIDIVAPHLALGEASTVDVYVQTDRARSAAGQDAKGFDINAPGTLRYTGTLGKRNVQRVPQRGGFVARLEDRGGNDYERARVSREAGRFRLSVPLVTGPLPAQSYADPAAVYERKLDYPDGLAAKTGERVHIGVAYKDKDGKPKWATASAKVITRPILDLMQEDYRTPVSESHVGEKLYVRVVDLSADTSGERDSVRVYMQTKSGAKHYVTLDETSPYSGVFKGVVQLTYAKQGAPAQDPDEYDVRRNGFPVVYGDAMGVQYTDASGVKTPAEFVTVLKGADGSIAPFSKQYDDSETAMRTQFAMAESYLELARRHRALGAEQQAEREFTRAKQLLAKTIATFTEPQTRAHAEYLLGNLTIEDAEVAEDPQVKQARYQAALARFMKVTGSYPDTTFASKAQFKTAIVYERLGEPDIAAQEYVKLAYKHPESEHLATAMARLGTHFQRKAVGFEDKSKPLLEQKDDKDAQFEGEAMRRLAQAEYVKAAQIFERLQERFPDHELAGKAGLRAGQIYMRAEDYRSALKALSAVINDESYDGVTLRAQAMYWAGRCNVALNQALPAYALYKRITYDFPESDWAAYARAQLSTDQMDRLDRKLEIERLEAEQQ